jgi:hypothetical protein
VRSRKLWSCRGDVGNNARQQLRQAGIADKRQDRGGKLLCGAKDNCTLITYSLSRSCFGIGIGTGIGSQSQSQSQNQSQNQSQIETPSCSPWRLALGPLFREFDGLPPLVLSVFSRGPLIRWHSSAPVGSARGIKSCHCTMIATVTPSTAEPCDFKPRKPFRYLRG